MYEVSSPLRSGGSLTRADPQFIAHAMHLMNFSSEQAVDALGNLAALESMTQRGLLERVCETAETAVSNYPALRERNMQLQAAFAKGEVTASALLGRAFGNMGGIVEYIEDCNYMLGSRCRNVLTRAIHSNPQTISQAAGVLGFSQGYLEIALLRCAYGT